MTIVLIGKDGFATSLSKFAGNILKGAYGSMTTYHELETLVSAKFAFSHINLLRNEIVFLER